MTHSVNEVTALATKAARGAGFPQAQAGRFGQALVQHLILKGPATVVLDALRDPGDSPILRLPLLMDDVLRARALAGTEVTLGLLPQDRDLVPAYLALLPMQVEVTIQPREDGPFQMHLRLGPVKRAQAPGRLSPPVEMIDALEQLAARMLVPASDASRQGAGAGTTDND